jgi:hypothetical protein
MLASNRPEGSTSRFFENKHRRCAGCGSIQRYDYNTSGRSIRRLDEFLWVVSQVVYCENGRCPLVRKGIHCQEEWALAPAYERFGNDVIALCGVLHYGQGLDREAIARQLEERYGVKLSSRTAYRLYKFYGALLSGAHLSNAALIRDLKKQRVVVLSLDGAEPIKGREPVWFVRDTVSGRVLASRAMVSCTAADLVELLEPVVAFCRAHGIRIAGVVSDAEENVRAAIKKILPGVPHQLCQIHYVKNLAKSIKGVDSELRKDLKKNARGLRQIEREIRTARQPGGQLCGDDADTLMDICVALRSILRDPGRPPFEPPGLKLFSQLVELQGTLADMARKKGGPC